LDVDNLGSEVAKLDWYHTMELPGGVVTQGKFDHRGVVPLYGFPADLSGKRVLDVGTFDGFFAFEFEKRGADEVIAIDLSDREALDWPVPLRQRNVEEFRPRSTNFELAKQALGSRVQHVICSAYDANPDALGTFDLVFVGSLLVHLRDPVRALMALRTVCRGEIQLSEHTQGRFGGIPRNKAVARFEALGPYLTWWVPNRSCLDQWLLAAGFVDVRRGKTFTVPFRGRRGGIQHSVAHAQPGPTDPLLGHER